MIPDQRRSYDRREVVSRQRTQTEGQTTKLMADTDENSETPWSAKRSILIGPDLTSKEFYEYYD